MGDQVLLELRFNADPKQLRMVREQVSAVLEPLGCGRKLTADLVIAVNEACMNVIQHAYKGDASGEIVLEIINNGSELLVNLVDFAAPIDPSKVRPRDINELRPGGLGTHFIRELMDETVYGHLADRNGNVLRMRKKLQSGAEQVENAGGD
jgi:sigma-B regulation protein RsbU (phosphoserine phosphatase)